VAIAPAATELHQTDGAGQPRRRAGELPQATEDVQTKAILMHMAQAWADLAVESIGPELPVGQSDRPDAEKGSTVAAREKMHQFTASLSLGAYLLLTSDSPTAERQRSNSVRKP